MDESYVTKLTESLKSTSSKRIQDTLLIIKNNVITNDRGIKLFRDYGGLDNLLPHLRKPNEKILDMTLSILGNCCLDEKSRDMVGKLNIFGSLVLILETVCRDSILGRTCRVIGNLAQKHSNAKELHNYGAVKAIISLIETRDDSTSTSTLIMAVRAIRQLWAVTEKREEMLSLNAVKCIAILLVEQCECIGIIPSLHPKKKIVEMKKSREEIIIGILKCFDCFTAYAHPRCTEQIQGDGRCYESLIALTKLFESNALKCLINICSVSSRCPSLGKAGLVECLVNILRKFSDVALWPKGSAKALVQLSRNSVNRSKLRYCGGLPLLVSVAKENPKALHALLYYVYDDSMLQIFVDEGLISILTDKLTDYLKTMDFEHDPEQNVHTKATQNIKSEERGERIVFGKDLDSDTTDDSENEKESQQPKQKSLKRPFEISKYFKKHQLTQLTSPEWPWWYDPCIQEVTMSPDGTEKYPSSPYSDGNQSRFSPENKRISSNKRPRWDWSPQSITSAGEGSSSSPCWTDYQCSPSSSCSPTSPFSNNGEDSSDSEISGRYSPVCSEQDGEVEQSDVNLMNQVLEADATQAAHDLDALVMLDDKSVNEEKPSEDDGDKMDVNVKSSNIKCILELLLRVTFLPRTYDSTHGFPVTNRTLDLLTGRECLNALLDYLERSKNTLGVTASILRRVFGNPLCLRNILKNRLVFRLCAMIASPKHVTKCRQCLGVTEFSDILLTLLKTVAESDYGIGEISYQLLKGSSYMKQTLSLTLPHVVSTVRLLKKYYLDFNALDLLINIISDSKEDIHDCVRALEILAYRAQIKDPKILETRFKDKICVTYDPVLDNLSVDEIVTFELDDASTVKANKVFLCQNSDVFSAMLLGCFKESVENCVRLGGVSKPALEYLFTLLNFGLNNPNNEVQIFPLTDSLTTNLETLLLADRFLFDKIKELLSTAILQFNLSPETADKIYVWSLSDGVGFLCVESVAYLLTGSMRDVQRIQCFKNILDLKYKEQWLEDIKHMIRRQLIQ